MGFCKPYQKNAFYDLKIASEDRNVLNTQNNFGFTIQEFYNFISRISILRLHSTRLRMSLGYHPLYGYILIIHYGILNNSTGIVPGIHFHINTYKDVPFPLTLS